MPTLPELRLKLIDCAPLGPMITHWKTTLLGFLLTSWLLVSYYGSRTDLLKASSRYSNLQDGIGEAAGGAGAGRETSGFRRPPPLPYAARTTTRKHFMRPESDDRRGSSSATTTVSSFSSEYSFATAKKILYFTPYFDMKDFNFGFGHEPFLAHGCPVSNCFATNDRDLLPSFSDYDAILFHMRDVDRKRVQAPNQAKRSAGQRYVMFLMESPSNDGFPYDKLKNFFNWTMTYRMDSDIPQPYGWIEPKDRPYTYPPLASDMEKWLPFDDSKPAARRDALERVSKKKKMVAWIVSNCNTCSQREHFVQELSNHIEVDVMGGCGSIACDRANCSQTIDADYKFYLSFENSFCNGYATEKFFGRVSQDMIPIVFGKADYSAIAPPHSYINALDFDSPKLLADFLLELDKDDEAYLSYFWWKEHYRVRLGAANAFCRLCAKLNDPQEPAKVYEDLTDWWVKGGNCEQKGSFPWSRQENFLMDSVKDFATKLLGKTLVA